MKRIEIIDHARKDILSEWDDSLGSPWEYYSLVAKYWVTYLEDSAVPQGTDVTLGASDIATMMLLAQVAWIAIGHPGEDSWAAIAKYASHAGECITPPWMDRQKDLE